MKQTLLLGSLLSLLLSLTWGSVAQDGTPEQGDPPIASLISISPPDEAGVVTISGAAGAVFPAAQVAVRNLFTTETVYVNAGITGAFTATLYGPGNTPFWISPAVNIPGDLRDRPGSLPGGPGTIVYGSRPDAPAAPEPPITQLIIDAQRDDWAAYPTSDLDDDVFALLNTESLYLSVTKDVPLGSQLVIQFELDGILYQLTLEPSLPQTGLIREIAPTERDLGTFAASVAIDAETDIIEVRFSLASLAPSVERIVLEEVFVRTVEGTLNDVTEVMQVVPTAEEQDGIVYDNGAMTDEATRFSIGGPLAQGAARWSALGRTSALNATPGETITVELDLSLDDSALAETLVGLSLIGEMTFQPVVAETSNGLETIPAFHSSNGWSNLQTPSGLAISNLRADIPIARVTVPAPRIVRKNGALLAGMRFEITLPDDLPNGIYVPTFTGKAQIGDGEVFNWTDNGVFGEGEGINPQPLTRLPLVFNVGGLEDIPLMLTLLHDTPSDGSRGILSQADQENYALANRVRFESASYVLPPGNYPIEPYLLMQTANAHEDTIAPLLPLLLPGGRLNATITRPDGSQDDLDGAPIAQNQLSTMAVDERNRFGAQSPIDAYRLTTLEASYTDYVFDQYGTYTVDLTATFEDIYGNGYTGGGLYEITIAEPLDLSPGVLSGAPFYVGDDFFAGGHIAPGVPAEVDINLTVYALDGEVIEQRYEGIQADDYGYFVAEPFVFEVPGEYVIDYEARYSDPDGRLWAASLRSAGVVAPVDGALVAHGRRGVVGYAGSESDNAYRPAWFTTQLYPPEGIPQDMLPETFEGTPMLNYPYHHGDVAYLLDGLAGQLRPTMRVQDVTGGYARWLQGSVMGYADTAGFTLAELNTLDELPLTPILAGPPGLYNVPLLPDFVVNDAYAYLSAVRPGVSVRQLVLGQDDRHLPFAWDNDDPLNQQIGAGIDGNREGDYVFLFGGAVVRNAEANVLDTAGYAALAVVGDAEDTETRIYPPYRGAAGGPDGGALLTIKDEPVDMFFHPTGAKPGQVREVGSMLTIAGHAAPTLQTQVEVVVTAPDGTEYAFDGLTNPIGHFYDPANDLTLDTVGVWSVQVIVTAFGTNAAGQVEAPFPQGSVLGVTEQTFRVFVVPANAEPLQWTQGGGSPTGDVDNPGFRPASAFNIGLPIPAEWENPQGFYTISIAETVLDSGELRRSGTIFPYQYSPSTLALAFPQFEILNNTGSGPAASDVVRLTFAITGEEPDGDTLIRTRTFTLFHNRLMSFDDQEALLGE